jgi:hypothetical protein
MSEYRARFIFSISTARRAYRSILWEQQFPYIIVTPFAFAWAITSLGSRDYAPLAGFVLGVVAMFWTSWLSGFRHAGRVALASSSPEIEVVATEDALIFRTPQVESIIRWSGVQALYRLRRYWIVFRGGWVNPSFIPVEALSEEGRQFVEKQIRGAGGRVR